MYTPFLFFLFFYLKMQRYFYRATLLSFLGARLLRLNVCFNKRSSVFLVVLSLKTRLPSLWSAGDYKMQFCCAEAL